MTRIYDRDFRFLLARLVPQHRLSPDLRRDVGRALRGSAGTELRRQSVRALEALCDASYFERAGLSNSDGHVVVAYRRPRGSMRLSVAVPLGEWEKWSNSDPGVDVPRAVEGPGVPGTPVVPAQFLGTDDAPLVAAAPPVADDLAPVFGALQLLPEITRSFTVSDGTIPVLDRLDTLIATLEEWLGFTGGHLDVVADTLVVGGDEGGKRVRVVADDDLRASDFVRGAVEAGARRYATVPAEGIGASGNGTTIGVAPIFLFGKIVGALQVRFTAMEQSAMDARLDTAAGVVRNVIEFNHRFASLTSIDSLTGVYNRQFMDRQLPVEIERAMRSGSALSMLVIDVDDFKRINDELGHKKGDEALVAIAEIIRRNLRKVDMPFRYGGEEIVILLPGTPEFEALHTAERLRRVIAQYRGFRDTTGKIRDLSVSVGVAVYPDTARSGEQLFGQADEAMYHAKQRGKNQVVLYSKK